jgi:DNA replication protein DnaC
MSRPLPLSNSGNSGNSGSPSHPLDDALRRLQLPGFRKHHGELADRAVQENWTYPEFLEALVRLELEGRTEGRIARATRQAGFPFIKTIETFDFQFQTTVTRRQLGAYLGPELISEGRNLILWGPAGVGKTALCIALAYKAIQHGAEARFVTCTELIHQLTEARRHGKWEATLKRVLTPEVLIVDEVGYLGYGPEAASVLFPVIDQRYLRGNRPVLLTTNKDPRQWGEVLHDPDLSAAILDRLLHHGEVLRLGGRSYRQYRPGQAPGGREGGELGSAERVSPGTPEE